MPCSLEIERMRLKLRGLMSLAVLIGATTLGAQKPPNNSAGAPNDSDVRPPVTQDDVRIVQRAREILNSPEKWNRADNRICPAEAKTFSLYCALEKATDEVSGNFTHRGAAMQEARFVIEEVYPDWKKYNHRLMDYNNDPKTTFADIQKVFALLEDHIVKRLKEESPAQEK
jgi:hypothetical protein